MITISGGEKAEEFFREALKLLNKHRILFMIGGSYAVGEYTNIDRQTKDLDVFCKASDHQNILKLFQDEGYNIELTDPRWLAKIKKKNYLIDLIFGTAAGSWTVDDSWFEGTPETNLFGIKVKLIAPEEMIWCRAYVQGRDRFDGADIYHMILKKGKTLDWKRLLRRMDAHWEVLFAHIINYRFIYPSEREIVPKWLMEELMKRLENQFTLPNAKEKISRGTLFSKEDYSIDISEWGYHDFHLPVKK